MAALNCQRLCLCSGFLAFSIVMPVHRNAAQSSLSLQCTQLIGQMGALGSRRTGM